MSAEESYFFCPASSIEKGGSVKQMAIRMKYSQQWIKIYNIFTPTARHNDKLYSLSTTEYQILELQSPVMTATVCKV